MPQYIATMPLQIRITPKRVIKVTTLIPFNLDKEIGTKLEKSEPYRTGIIQKHDGQISKEDIEEFRQLGLAILLSSKLYGDVWLIPHHSAKAQIGLETVTLLPEELEILHTMDPVQIKRVFLVKRQFPGTSLKEHQLL